MKKLILILSILFIAGCSYAGREPWHNYLHVPRAWLMDPHFSEYKQAREQLELEHIKGKCSYVEYKEKMQQLNMKYQEEVNKREETLSFFE
ncbi:MAG: hypothetical protein H6756_02515 [Candidatus Omnitrophica bacterium]|nr:hypothetical protein [Candidatus Omnitrophota bacterium]